MDEAILTPAEKGYELDAPCGIGYISIYPERFKFHKTMQADTIWCDFEHRLYGWMTVPWVDGQINWECIGDVRRCEDFGFNVRTSTDTCYFIIPKLEDCNL